LGRRISGTAPNLWSLGNHCGLSGAGVGFRNQSLERVLARVGADLNASEGAMASKLKIKVNGLVHSVTASLDTPLLYVLHNELHLHGPRFGCGLAQCGACSVLLDGKEIRSCVTPVAAV